MTRRRSKRSRRNILMQGAIGDRLCWYPLAQRLHVVPVTPSLHGHWPVVWLHVRPDAPTGWHSHSVTPNQSMKHNTHTYTHTHTHVACARHSPLTPMWLATWPCYVISLFMPISSGLILINSINHARHTSAGILARIPGESLPDIVSYLR